MALPIFASTSSREMPFSLPRFSLEGLAVTDEQTRRDLSQIPPANRFDCCNNVLLAAFQTAQGSVDEGHVSKLARSVHGSRSSGANRLTYSIASATGVSDGKAHRLASYGISRQALSTL